MAATRLISMHKNKEKTIAQSLRDRADYAKNGEKTEDGEYISSYECNAGIADQEFLSARSEYLKNHHSYKGDIIAYQIRQSFKPGEITPEEANRVGYETAMRFTKGKHAFFVATHTDRAHIHNHIIFNSVNLDCNRKFRDFFFSGIALQRVSDLVCLEHGLSVIEKRKPSERQKRTTYPKRKAYRSDICEIIDGIIAEGPKDYEEFLKRLQEEGFEIKRGKHTAIRGKEQKRFIRLSSLGEGYREEDLRRIISGEDVASKQRKVKHSEKSFDMLLDIQEIIAKGKGAGYERWAKVYNIKQVAKVLLFLQMIVEIMRLWRREPRRHRQDSLTYQRRSKLQKVGWQRLQLSELTSRIIPRQKMCMRSIRRWASAVSSSRLIVKKSPFIKLRRMPSRSWIGFPKGRS